MSFIDVSMCFKVVLLCMGVSCHAYSNEVYGFNLKGKKFDEILDEVVSQTGIQVLYKGGITLTNNNKTYNLIGFYDVDAVIDKLSEDASIVFEKVMDGTYLIFPKVEKNNIHDPSENKVKSTLEEVVVVGHQEIGDYAALNNDGINIDFDKSNISRINNSASVVGFMPGVWIETSGGVAGANVFYRGMPSRGDAPYVSVGLNGINIFPSSSLSFLEPFSLFRLDQSVSTVNISVNDVKNAILQGNVGLSVNYELLEGGEQGKTLVEYTGSDYGSRRFDFVNSGFLRGSWYYMFGGYGRRSNNIRGSDFNTEEGRQFTFDLSHSSETRKIKFYGRRTYDFGAWHTTIPSDVEEFEGNGLYIGSSNRYQTLVFSGVHGDINQRMDLGKGRGWDGYIYGVQIEHQLNPALDFELKYSRTGGNADTAGIVPSGPIMDIRDIRFVNGGLEGGDYIGNVQQVGFWVADKRLNSTVFDIRLVGEHALPSGEFLAGFSQTAYEVNDRWSLDSYSHFLMARPGGKRLDIDCEDSILENLCGWRYNLLARGKRKNDSAYFFSRHRLNRFAVQIGYRRTKSTLAYRAAIGLENGIEFDLATNLPSKVLVSGLDFDLGGSSRVFFKRVKSTLIPDFDFYRQNFSDIEACVSRCEKYSNVAESINQKELGLSWAKGTFEGRIAYYVNEINNSWRYQDTVPISARSKGLELQLDYQKKTGLSILTSLSYLKSNLVSRYEHSELNLIRQPNWFVHLLPQYSLNYGKAQFAVYSKISIIGPRHMDSHTMQLAEKYEHVDVGIKASYNNTEFGFIVKNVSNVTDFTEVGVAEGQEVNVRTLDPRHIEFNIKYLIK